MTPEELTHVCEQQTRDLLDWLSSEGHNFSTILELPPVPEAQREAVVDAMKTVFMNAQDLHDCDHSNCLDMDSHNCEAECDAEHVTDDTHSDCWTADDVTEKEDDVTKRDFEAIATAVRDNYTGPLRRDVALQFARVLADTNPRFDGDRFMAWATDGEMTVFSATVERNEEAQA